MTKRTGAVPPCTATHSASRQEPCARCRRSVVGQALILADAWKPWETDLFLEALWPTIPALVSGQALLRMPRRDLMFPAAIPPVARCAKEIGEEAREIQSVPPDPSLAHLRPQ
jgi:hypothetical protein